MTKKLQNYIDGEWVDANTDTYTPVHDPATCEVLAEVPESTREDVDAAVEAAQEAFIEWRQTPVMSRARYMFTLKALLEERFEEISEIVVKENGKTRDEARGELRRGIESVEFAAGVPSMMRGYKVEDIASGIDETAERQPIGVFAAITPFNFPVMIPLWFLPTAITTGNTFILKPSPQTPLSSEILMEIVDELDLPEGTVNLVQGGIDASQAILEHPGITGISFVGSTPVAKIVYETGTKHGKRVQAQGGAKNYIAVLPDANVEASVKNILGAAYGCAGQRCLAAANAVLVGEGHDEFKQKLIDGAKSLRVGYGLEETSQMGTVINEKSRARIEKMIQDAIDNGATVLLDGRNLSVEGFEKGTWVGPTILDNVTPDMEIAQEEVFGPVLTIMNTEDFDEAVDTINGLRFGNAASIFTNNGGAAREFKYRVNAGNIGVNIGVAAAAASFPFGGQKDSFFGDLHGQGQDSIEFYTDHKVVIERWFD